MPTSPSEGPEKTVKERYTQTIHACMAGFAILSFVENFSGFHLQDQAVTLQYVLNWGTNSDAKIDKISIVQQFFGKNSPAQVQNPLRKLAGYGKYCIFAAHPEKDRKEKVFQKKLQNCLSLQPVTDLVLTVMTTMELNAQIWRDMATIADNETLMKQLAKYLKKLVAKKELMNDNKLS